MVTLVNPSVRLCFDAELILDDADDLNITNFRTHLRRSEFFQESCFTVAATSI